MSKFNSCLRVWVLTQLDSLEYGVCGASLGVLLLGYSDFTLAVLFVVGSTSFLYICIYVYLCEFICLAFVQVATEARRRLWASWNWSKRQS